MDGLGDVCGDEMSSDEEEEAIEEDGGGEPVGVELKDDDDAPLVQVEPGIGGTDCLTEDGQCVNYPTLAEDAAFICRYKQIKAATEAGLDPRERRGCVVQFSPDEVVALQLSAQDVSKGETDFLFFSFFLFFLINTGYSFAHLSVVSISAKSSSSSSFSSQFRLVFLFLSNRSNI